MTRIAVFAYGSLADPASAARTLGRPLPAAPQVALLRGWRRRWTQARDNRTCEKTFARASDGSIPQHVLGLNIERIGEFVPHTETNSPIGANGVLIEVSERELERLDVREMRYDRTEVTGEIELGGQAAFDLVVTYVAKPAHHAPELPADAVVLASYVAAVEAAFTHLGADQLDAYRRSTDQPPVEVTEATLVRDHIPPGNPRDW